tara:strand:- start:701 stop:859 length:159 start_codon:yes stop_codon:yes gene_type:complete
MKKINWINSWKKGNKKNKIQIIARIGLITVFEFYWNPGTTFRLLILNCGIEI